MTLSPSDGAASARKVLRLQLVSIGIQVEVGVAINSADASSPVSAHMSQTDGLTFRRSLADDFGVGICVANGQQVWNPIQVPMAVVPDCGPWTALLMGDVDHEAGEVVSEALGKVRHQAQFSRREVAVVEVALGTDRFADKVYHLFGNDLDRLGGVGFERISFLVRLDHRLGAEHLGKLGAQGGEESLFWTPRF